MFLKQAFLLVPLLVTAAGAETIILKEGTFIEGEIIVETSRTIRVKTPFGTRTYNRRDIEQIVETIDDTDPDAVNKFADLPPVLKAVLNARADYDLKNCERALSRLEPYREYDESRGIRITIDWLIIEINERLARWETAVNLLEDKKENGTAREKVRAKAHLDIFEVNPKYDLRYVGKKHARNFIKDEEILYRAREPDALAGYEIMRLALEEYCEQLLVEEKFSVKKFAAKLKVKETYEACKKLPRSGDVDKRLPYFEDLKKAEDSLRKAQSILGDYGMGFELDLVRTEIIHLQPILGQLRNEAFEASPEEYDPAFDPRTGRLTPTGRDQWRERCDEFLQRIQPVVRLLEYALEKMERYPNEMHRLLKYSRSMDEQIKHMIQAVKKARRRTHV